MKKIARSVVGDSRAWSRVGSACVVVGSVALSGCSAWSTRDDGKPPFDCSDNATCVQWVDIQFNKRPASQTTEEQLKSVWLAVTRPCDVIFDYGRTTVRGRATTVTWRIKPLPASSIVPYSVTFDATRRGIDIERDGGGVFENGRRSADGREYTWNAKPRGSKDVLNYAINLQLQFEGREPIRCALDPVIVNSLGPES